MIPHHDCGVAGYDRDFTPKGDRCRASLTANGQVFFSLRLSREARDFNQSPVQRKRPGLVDLNDNLPLILSSTQVQRHKDARAIAAITGPPCAVRSAERGLPVRRKAFAGQKSRGRRFANLSHWRYSPQADRPGEPAFSIACHRHFQFFVCRTRVRILLVQGSVCFSKSNGAWSSIAADATAPRTPGRQPLLARPKRRNVKTTP